MVGRVALRAVDTRSDTDDRSSRPVADLDRASTTPVRPEAIAAMEPFLAHRYGNPSAAHALGRDAVRALDEAREQLAELLGCTPGEVVLTSGGTESDAHAVTGGIPVRSGRILCSAVEHPAVLGAVRALGGETVAVDRAGRVDLDSLADALDADDPDGRPVELVSVMAANNELGTVNDLDAVADVVAAHAPVATLHTDAVQAAPWLDLAAVAAPAGLVSISAHKFGGPKGVGALVVRSGVAVRPLLHGGGQEWGRRSGTNDVAGAVGMAAALAAVAAGRAATARRVAALRDRLADGLCRIDGVEWTVADAAPDHVLPNALHLLIDDVDSEPLLFLLDREGVRASASSACASGAVAPSHVLSAIRPGTEQDDGRRRGALRLSLGHDVDRSEVDHALAVIPGVVDHLRRSASSARPRTAGVSAGGAAGFPLGER